MKYYLAEWMFINGRDSQCWTGAPNTQLSARDRELVEVFYPHWPAQVRQMLAARKDALGALASIEGLSNEQREGLQSQLMRLE
jgi:hypothetical protein